MARKPRPVDPAAGPIPAFAHDLRKVREEAGEPTYRALATLAGFSATTLSDAAGGVRFPSLEVTLAYVGACGGDVGAWERRWQDLDRELAGERAASASAAPAAPTPLAAAPGGGAAAPVPATVRGALATVATVAPPAPPSPAVPELISPVDTVTSGRPPRPFAALPTWARWSAAATVLALAAAFGLLTLHPTGGRAARGRSRPGRSPGRPTSSTPSSGPAPTAGRPWWRRRRPAVRCSSPATAWAT
ncbi:helix-turn-helix transcriptional regulator [Kitasatospora paranensis]|uniref:helix-turn-helix domain-containing protein n=1 Tax=Kitasatospora paranensis TaxID=258053 RepID=UPI0031EB665E